MKGIAYGWKIVLACTLGMAMSPGTLAFYSLGIFIKPLNAAYGWDRAEVSFVATILTLGIMLGLPLIGMLVDRYGPRRVLVPSLVLLGTALVSLTLVDTLWQFYLVFAVIGFVCAGANSLAYMRILSTWFDRRRGLVIGLASAGMGIGVMVIPPFAQFMMSVSGWQAAYAGLGIFVLAIGVPVIALTVRDTPQELGLSSDAMGIADAGRRTPVTGYLMPEIVRMRQFWMLLLIFLAIAGAINAVAMHLVPLIQDRGSPSSVAVLAASLFGGAMICGRLLTGMLLDRYFGPHVAAAFFSASTLAIIALAAGATGVSAVVASVFVGICSGAEGDVLGYLISRYFGIRCFGKVYGYTLGVYMIGVSTVPFLMGLGFEMTGSYTSMLIVCVLLNALSTVLLMFLGPFPRLPESVSASVETAGAGIGKRPSE
jgi:MFS family permease